MTRLPVRTAGRVVGLLVFTLILGLTGQLLAQGGW
jgi:hypothetical protein